MIGKYYSIITGGRAGHSEAVEDSWDEVDSLLSSDSVAIVIGNLSCNNGVPWIWIHFGECVETPANMAGFVIGFISLILWLIPLIPQLYENYVRKSCEGLSFCFLLFWICGDSFNFAGAMLTHQLPIQIIIGVYYICQDLALLTQFLYYTGRSKWRRKESIHKPLDKTP